MTTTNGHLARALDAQTRRLQARQFIPLADQCVVPGCADLASTPICVNLTFYEGDDVFINLRVFSCTTGEPIDVTEGTAYAQIRDTTDAERILAAFTTTTTPPPVGETDPLPDTNIIYLWLQRSINRNMPATAVWDCQLDLFGVLSTLVAGNVTIVQEVTRQA